MFNFIKNYFYVIIILVLLSIVIILNYDNSNNNYTEPINVQYTSTIQQETISTTYTINTTTATTVTTTESRLTSSTCTTNKTTTMSEKLTTNKATTTCTETLNSDYNKTENYVEDENDSSIAYVGNFIAKWYDNRGLGYSEDRTLYGSSGRSLISGYSVASNYFSSGTILYIKGGCHDGYYRVDDTGGMTNDVIDFYYQRRSDIPSDFVYSGVYNIEVYVVD